MGVHEPCGFRFYGITLEGHEDSLLQGPYLRRNGGVGGPVVVASSLHYHSRPRP